MDSIDTEDESTIYSLPHGVVAHALNSLGPRDLASASCVCRLWRGIVSVDSNNVRPPVYIVKTPLIATLDAHMPPVNAPCTATRPRSINYIYRMTGCRILELIPGSCTNSAAGKTASRCVHLPRGLASRQHLPHMIRPAGPTGRSPHNPSLSPS